MNMHLMKVLGVAGSAGALALLCLTTGGARADAAAPGVAGHAAPAASLEVPAGFEPDAASLVSSAWGVVLGGSGCASSRPCPARLAVTADGGARWSLMRAPAVWLAGASSDESRQVNQVLFASPADGWLYDQYGSRQMWVTGDGGASWREITLPGDIETMAASAHTVYAVVGGSLYRSPIGQNAWSPVSSGTKYGPVTGSTLAVSGNSVWLGTGSYLWTTADGTHWARYPLRSPGKAYGVPYGLSGIAAASPADVAFLWGAAQGMYHTVMRVQVSFNGGRTERQTLNAPPSAGDIYGLAVAPGQFGVLLVAVVTPGEDLIYRTANLGRTWTTFGTPGTQGGVQLNSLEFISPVVACYVAGDPEFGEPGELMWTTNAGLSWHKVRF